MSTLSAGKRRERRSNFKLSKIVSSQIFANRNSAASRKASHHLSRISEHLRGKFATFHLSSRASIRSFQIKLSSFSAWILLSLESCQTFERDPFKNGNNLRLLKLNWKVWHRFFEEITSAWNQMSSSWNMELYIPPSVLIIFPNGGFWSNNPFSNRLLNKWRPIISQFAPLNLINISRNMGSLLEGFIERRRLRWPVFHIAEWAFNNVAIPWSRSRCRGRGGWNFSFDHAPSDMASASSNYSIQRAFQIGITSSSKSLYSVFKTGESGVKSLRCKAWTFFQRPRARPSSFEKALGMTSVAQSLFSMGGFNTRLFTQCQQIWQRS